MFKENQDLFSNRLYIIDITKTVLELVSGILYQKRKKEGTIFHKVTMKTID